MRRRQFPAELGFVPPGGDSDRCAQCGKTISVAWVICALSQMHAEEMFFVWNFLRSDRRLRAFREMKKQERRIT